MSVGGASVIARANWGALAALRDDSSGMPYWEVTDDGRDTVRIARRFQDENDRRQAPASDTLSAHIDDVVIGFAAAYETLAPSVPEFRREAVALGVRGRVLLRPTQAYGDAIMAAHHPAALVDRDENLAMLKKQLQSSAGSLGEQTMGSEEISTHEAAQLYAMHIPAYEAEIAASSLSVAGREVPLTSAQQTIERRYAASLDDRTAPMLRDEIVKTINAFTLSSRLRHGRGLTGAAVPRTPRTVSVRDAISTRASSLARLARADSPSSWMTVVDDARNLNGIDA